MPAGKKKMALINNRTIKLDVSDIVTELRRLNYNLEQIFQVNKTQPIPGQDFDPDEFSMVSYYDEEAELVQQHLDKRVGGVPVNDLGL